MCLISINTNTYSVKCGIGFLVIFQIHDSAHKIKFDRAFIVQLSYYNSDLWIIVIILFGWMKISIILPHSVTLLPPFFASQQHPHLFWYLRYCRRRRFRLAKRQVTNLVINKYLQHRALHINEYLETHYLRKRLLEGQYLTKILMKKCL